MLPKAIPQTSLVSIVNEKANLNELLFYNKYLKMK